MRMCVGQKDFFLIAEEGELAAIRRPDHAVIPIASRNANRLGGGVGAVEQIDLSCCRCGQKRIPPKSTSGRREKWSRRNKI